MRKKYISAVLSCYSNFLFFFAKHADRFLPKSELGDLWLKKQVFGWGSLERECLQEWKMSEFFQCKRFLIQICAQNMSRKFFKKPRRLCLYVSSFHGKFDLLVSAWKSLETLHMPVAWISWKLFYTSIASKHWKLHLLLCDKRQALIYSFHDTSSNETTILRKNN